MGDAARFGDLHPADARGFESRRPPGCAGKTREGSEVSRQEAFTQAPRGVPGPPRVPKAPVLRNAPRRGSGPVLPPQSYKLNRRDPIDDEDIYQNKSPLRNSGPEQGGIYQNDIICPTYDTDQDDDNFYEPIEWKPDPEGRRHGDSYDTSMSETMTSQSDGSSSVFQGQSLLDANSTFSPADSTRSLGPSFVQTGQGSLSDLSASSDRYFGYEKVTSLTADNFHNFVANKDLVMVMFYDPFDPNTSVPKGNFKKAVKTRGSDQFAAVDCQNEPDFCESIDVKSLPMFKFYSWGKVVGTIREMSHFDDKTMIDHLDTLGSLSHKLKTRADTQSTQSTQSKQSVKSKCSLAKLFGFKK